MKIRGRGKKSKNIRFDMCSCLATYHVVVVTFFLRLMLDWIRRPKDLRHVRILKIKQQTNVHNINDYVFA